MARRSRGRNKPADSGTVEKPQAKTVYEVPLALIEEASKVYEKVNCRLYRRRPDGKLSTIGSHIFSTPELSQIEAWLKERAGGGHYRVDPRKIDNFFELAEPLRPFEFDIEGYPKPATMREHGLDPVPGAGGGLDKMAQAVTDIESGAVMSGFIPSNGPGGPGTYVTAEQLASLPTLIKQYPIEAQIDWIRNQRGGLLDPNLNPANRFNVPVASIPSDQMALRQAEKADEELKQERAKFERERAENDRRFNELMKRFEDERQARLKSEADAERKMLEAKLEALTQRLNEPKREPAFSPEILATVAPVLGGIVTAFINSNANKTQALALQQTETHKVQMESVNALLAKASQPQPDPLKGLLEVVGVILPAVAPVVKTMIESKSPKAQSELWNSVVEGQANNLMMFANMVEQLAKAGGGGQEPWYMPLVANMLGSLQSVAENFSKAQKAPNAPQSINVQQPGVPGAAPQQNTSQNGQSRQTRGQQIAVMVMNSAGFPQEMKTEGWFHLIAKLHDHEDPLAVADYAAGHLSALAEADKIPEAMRESFDNDPRGTLEKLISVLPVAQSKEYVNAFLDALMMVFEGEEEEESEDVSEDSSEEPRQEVRSEPVQTKNKRDVEESIETVAEPIPLNFQNNYMKNALIMR